MRVSLSKRNLEAVQKELLKRKYELEAELTQLSKERFSDSPQGQDIADQALSSSMENLKMSLQDSGRMEYDRIIRALEKCEDGSYGICSDCENEISEKRLKSFPNAERCIVCQEAFEEGGG